MDEMKSKITFFTQWKSHKFQSFLLLKTKNLNSRSVKLERDIVIETEMTVDDGLSNCADYSRAIYSLITAGGNLIGFDERLCALTNHWVQITY